MRQQPKKHRIPRGASGQLHRTGDKRLPREYSIGDFLDYIHGLAQAARKIEREEQLMLNFDPKGKSVN
jgi:hypothetical protein